ncbi:MAG: tryptophan--tRNA ligase [Nanoarchaeota archaeon]|nr:tryptophan--tRNA ligase [Nanoarchaeota archaeon]
MAKTIDVYGSELVEDYAKVVRDFGLEEFDPSIFPEPSRIMRRGEVFAGRGLKIIADCIKNKKPFYVLSGIMPTGDKLHFGSKLVVEQIAYFQKHGAKAYILVADLEAMASRGVTLEQAKQRALDFHIPAYIALGLDPKKTIFYFQSENKDVVHLAYEFAKKITLNEFKSIYGSADPGRIMSAVTQVADMVYPQLEERMPGIIPVGIDQDPHIRLARDVIRRVKDKKLFPISSIYHKFTASLDGSIKMSKSRSESCIELPEDVKSVSKKIKRALTGGRDTVDEQKKLGGVPEKCMIFQIYKQHFIEDDSDLDNVYDKCRKGTLLCGQDKIDACEHMTRFMEDFVKKIEKARKIVPKLNFVKF